MRTRSRRSLHAAFQEMRYAKLFPDLAQVAPRRLPISHHTGAADDFEVGDLGQVGQDFVLHAIGKVGVCFVSLRFSKGRTAIDFSGTRFVAAAVADGEATCLARRRVRRGGTEN